MKRSILCVIGVCLIIVGIVEQNELGYLGAFLLTQALVIHFFVCLAELKSILK